MRTYAVKLPGGGRGPEFSSREEATAWGMRNVPTDEAGRVEFAIAYVRGGEEVGGCGVFGWTHPQAEAPPPQP